MLGGVPCSSSKLSKSSEDQAFTLWMNVANLSGWELVSEIAVIEAPSTEGGGNATKEGK